MYEFWKTYWNNNFSICNIEKTIKLSEKAVYKGHSKAQYWLEKIYFDRDRVNKDTFCVFDFLCEAANKETGMLNRNYNVTENYKPYKKVFELLV